jgi:hypothetical protein
MKFISIFLGHFCPSGSESGLRSRDPIESGSNLNTDPDPQHKGIVVEEAQNLRGIINDEDDSVKSLYLVAAFLGNGILLLSKIICGYLHFPKLKSWLRSDQRGCPTYNSN